MKNNLKFLSLGLLGGMLPLAVFVSMNSSQSSSHIDTIGTNSADIGAKNISFNSLPPSLSNLSQNENFVDASENSLNSVVHVTTTVETTSFQRDVFSEFFYGPGAGGREFKQFGSGSGSGVIISTDGYIVTNNHVIDNAKTIEVILNDNRKYKR